MTGTHRETAQNRPLSGAELRKRIHADCERLLDAEGLLASSVAYGRVSYELVLRLHARPQQEPSVTRLHSTHVASNVVAQPGNEALAAIVPPPLRGEDATDAVLSAHTVVRQVTSPNAERVRLGLPVPVEVRQQDSTKITQMVKYPPDETLGEGNVRVEDTTAEARREWGLPAVAAAPATQAAAAAAAAAPIPQE